jgi:hypothetical protein
MKNYYQFYLAEKEKLVAEKKATIDERINKARKDSVIISYLLQEEKELISYLQKELQEISLGNFLSRLHEIQMFDAEISEEDAFIQCFKEFKIENADNTIKKIAATKASDEIIQYCYFLMNSQSRNRINPESTPPDNSDKKNIASKNPIWVMENQTEFMQLIEGLIDLERIKPRPNQNKWDLINEIALFFGVPLSKNQISNLGKGKKSKQVPKLFHDLHNTYVEMHEVNLRK